MRTDSEPTARPVPLARVPLAVVAVCAAIGLAVLCVLFAGETAGTWFDAWLSARLVELGSPWRQLALVVDYTAEPVGGALTLGALVLVCLRLGHRRAAVLAVLGTGGSIACTTVLKPLVGREINGGFLAFPSGHTAAATAMALVVMLVVARRLVPILVVTVAAGTAMAWSQVLLNAHYATDTLGGFCAALAVVPAVAWTMDRVAGASQA
ncbi:phosphatase PAP2 family protein [Actinophytocola gossypii]|uniref:Phosphatase PAP2 family protein n=1 Tax=Actinophytocola gossypii TaxID=2812003 RepID=A0ABT2JD05_9PSEU|nr:phosphatase PAP2 family protein [Actinophytocola gossypii]MCT2585756.1 phosphatase PAP2 family protein [Actinophytocola gossypii]